LNGFVCVAALFFFTYELIKKMSGKVPAHYAPMVHMGAAATGEMVGKGLSKWVQCFLSNMSPLL